MRARLLWLLPCAAVVVWSLAVARADPQADPPIARAIPNPHGALRVDCGACHSPESFTKIVPRPAFDHAATGFPLKHAHAQARCMSCHRRLDFAQVPSACADCHRDPHRATLGFECSRCHAPTTWDNQRDLHRAHDRTRFPLLGTHASIDCASCHRQNSQAGFKGTPTDCVACHLPDYLATRDPDHARAGFSRRCADCHGMESRAWQGATGGGPHPPSFPLIGGHAGVPCGSCHANGFAGTSRECVSCHRDDYDRTRDPNHRSAGFPTTCQTCHSINSWEGVSGTFPHPASFPLTGAHTRVQCNGCHANGFAGTPSDCFSCHRADYDRATPNHRSAGFPTTCQQCHSTETFRGATFDHGRFFPIDSGAHRGIACTQCHTNPGNFRAFDCTNCHEHRRERMDDKHDDVRGYVYESRACYSCHPRGVE